MTSRLPRLIASDLDGTLLGVDGTISPRTRLALQLAVDSGALVVLASGRPASIVVDYLEGAAIGHFFVGTNGGSLHDLRTGEQLWQATYPMAEIRQLIAATRAALPGARFGLFTDLGGGYESGFAERLPAVPGLPVVDTVDLLAGDHVTRLAVFHPEQHVSEFIDLVASLAPPGIDVLYSGLDLAEAVPAGIDKGSALDRLAAAHGIDPRDAVVFGDQLNDLGMFRWAGRSFAMANSEPEVFDAATDRAGHHDDDAVAIELERLFAPVG